MIMKRLLLTAAVLLIMFFAGNARADVTGGNGLEAEHLKENSFVSYFDGVKHPFVLDLPKDTEGAALVLMLPGYGNSAQSLRTTVRFELEANPRGYAVAYVTGAKDPSNPLAAAGWNSGIASDGNDDVGFLVSLAKYLQAEYSLDPARTFAAGFSNGAFMAHRLAMEASETFAACVSIAGLMPLKIWEARNETNSVSFFQISGEKDDVVPKNSDGSAEHAKDPAIEDVMAYWAASNGLDSCTSEEIGNRSVLTKCRSEESQNQVWHLFVKDGRHSWPSAEQNNIDANRLILDFFDTVTP